MLRKWLSNTKVRGFGVTTIRSTCPDCGEVDLVAEGVVVTMGETADEGSYSFVCPKCLNEIEKRADQKTMILLCSVDNISLRGTQGDWDEAFAQELTCDVSHRWEFPVKMGQKCLCGKVTWSNNE